MNSKTIMTEGSIVKKILLFSLPLIIGNIFQQLYSSVDAAIVGNFVGSDALAAVNSGWPVIDTLLGFSVGIAAGAGVLIAQYYGMQDKERVSRAVHTSLIIAFFIGAFLTIFGIVTIPFIFRLIGTPFEIMGSAVLYMRIYFSGMIFIVLFNMASGILNAAGNSKWALVFLLISSVVNIILDLLFVIILRMGVMGVAIATLISQIVSCLLCFIYLARINDYYRFSPSALHLDHKMLKDIVTMSVPTGIQNTVKAFSNVLIQASVNSFGVAAVAGYSSFLKLDGFNWLPVMSLSMAAATFTGQNIGAGKNERVKKGLFTTVIMGVMYTAFIGIVTMIFARDLLSIFSKESNVIEHGLTCLKLFMPYYWMLGAFQIMLGCVRGLGKSVTSLILNTSAMCVLRIIYLYLLTFFAPSFTAAIAVYPVSWAFGLAITLVYIIYLLKSGAIYTVKSH